VARASWTWPGASRAAPGLGPQAVLAGRTDLLGLSALVASARLLVGPDTGVAHLATAFGTPSVVLFGPTSPALWGPPADRPQHRALWAGRTGDNFAAEPTPAARADGRAGARRRRSACSR
jgi:ADP-heptose:LPS heptosyltransferase